MCRCWKYAQGVEEGSSYYLQECADGRAESSVTVGSSDDVPAEGHHILTCIWVVDGTALTEHARLLDHLSNHQQRLAFPVAESFGYCTNCFRKLYFSKYY